MTTVGEIYQEIDRWAPFATAMEFDNPGLLVGDPETPVEKVLLALDITAAETAEAASLGCGLIVSHHPVIFHPLRRLGTQDAPYLLARAGIAAVCAHTNLDLAPGGVNACLAERLGLQKVRALCVDAHSGLPEALCGELPQAMQPEEFARYVKQALGCSGVEFTVGAAEIRTVGICGGAGASCAPDPAVSGVQAFVTGEAKHHELLAAVQSGLTLVVAGHYATEAVVLQPLREKLARAFPDVVFFVAQCSAAPSKHV